jgi:uncharacterized protein (UPF0332 family)
LAYHDELLQQANKLLQKNARNRSQADIRRSVSSAYYCLFHLLIFETSLNWSNETSRSGLARMFDHGVMKRACNKVADENKMRYQDENKANVQKLRLIARSFVQLQEKRHEADYNIRDKWTVTQARNEVHTARKALIAWQKIRTERIAQEFLVSLLIKPRD